MSIGELHHRLNGVSYDAEEENMLFTLGNYIAPPFPVHLSCSDLPSLVNRSGGRGGAIYYTSSVGMLMFQ